MAKSKPRRVKRRKTATKRSKTRRKTSVRKASGRKTSKRKMVKKNARSGLMRKRTTAEGMRRALKMKQAAEQREHVLHPQPAHNWPARIPQSTEPDPVPNNLREQGDIANIIQNTTSRRAG